MRTAMDVILEELCASCSELLKRRENKEVVEVDDDGNVALCPNCKEIFIPDEDYIFWNADYSGADAMVVAWDSECKWLIDFFKN